MCRLLPAVFSLLVAGPAAGEGTAERADRREWPQFRGAAGHTGVAPGDAVRPPLKLVWSYRCDSDTSGDAGAGVIVAGGKVFANM